MQLLSFAFSALLAATTAATTLPSAASTGSALRSRHLNSGPGGAPQDSDYYICTKTMQMQGNNCMIGEHVPISPSRHLNSGKPSPPGRKLMGLDKAAALFFGGRKLLSNYDETSTSTPGLSEYRKLLSNYDETSTGTPGLSEYRKLQSA